MNDIEKAIRAMKNLDDVISITESEHKSVKLAISALEKQLNNGWIPCSERIPNKDEYNKNDGRFIVSDGNKTYQCLFDVYDGEFKKLEYNRKGTYMEYLDNLVIAWQPLPEPYSEVNSNEN
jgi:hypothetical protein